MERLTQRAMTVWAYYHEQGIMLRWGSNVAFELKQFVTRGKCNDHIHMDLVLDRIENCMQAEIDIQLLGVSK
jgi:hypothetical protein